MPGGTYLKEGVAGRWLHESDYTRREGWTTSSKEGHCGLQLHIQQLRSICHCGSICNCGYRLARAAPRVIDKGSMHAGFTGGAALRRYQCDMAPKIQNLGITGISQGHPLLGSVTAKHNSSSRHADSSWIAIELKVAQLVCNKAVYWQPMS
jgi:hypothetical protein